MRRWQPDQPENSLSAEERRQHGTRIAELFLQHNRDLVRFLTHRLKNPHEAKEVAQEAYVQMLQLDAPGGVSYLKAFLFKTAANIAANRLKSATRRGRIEEVKFFDEGEVSPGPELAVAAEQELQRLSGFIDLLPARCRYALIMHRVYGHGFSELAQLMNISERMVRIYVARGLAFCQERLLDTGGPHG